MKIEGTPKEIVDFMVDLCGRVKKDFVLPFCETPHSEVGAVKDPPVYIDTYVAQKGGFAR